MVGEFALAAIFEDPEGPRIGPSAERDDLPFLAFGSG